MGRSVTFSANIYTPLDRGMIALQLCRGKFSVKKIIADFIRLKLNYIQKMENWLFEPPFGGLRGNVRISSIAHWKANERLLFAIIELFLLAVTVET